jgi:acyl-coenzyme A synthetase/AMP-(fatty) acid ligase
LGEGQPRALQVPREIVFLDELPRNATGKILERDLKDH